MPRKQLKRILEVGNLPNVFTFDDEYAEIDYRTYFNNNKPITLELACGGGEYSVELARRFPDRNFIGIDKKGHRIWKGAQAAIMDNIDNVAFIRCDIRLIGKIFQCGEIEDIWITFPDPYPKRSQAKHRLTAAEYLQMYKNLMIESGTVNLKTDSELFFESTLESIESNQFRILEREDDLYGGDSIDEILNIKTKYEKRHLANGKIIKYLKFALY